MNIPDQTPEPTETGDMPPELTPEDEAALDAIWDNLPRDDEEQPEDDE
jgi:hypothetical protein